MTDRVAEAMEEVWTWKRAAEEATKGMDSTQLIEFYRRQAEDAERRMGVHLKSRQASDVTPAQR